MIEQARGREGRRLGHGESRTVRLRHPHCACALDAEKNDALQPAHADMSVPERRRALRRPELIGGDTTGRAPQNTPARATAATQMRGNGARADKLWAQGYLVNGTDPLNLRGHGNLNHQHESRARKSRGAQTPISAGAPLMKPGQPREDGRKVSLEPAINHEIGTTTVQKLRAAVSSEVSEAAGSGGRTKGGDEPGADCVRHNPTHTATPARPKMQKIT